MKQRILLLFPSGAHFVPHYTNLGLPYIQAYLRANGFGDTIVANEDLVGRKKIRRLLREFQPTVVGVSCLTFYRHKALDLLRLSREFAPQAMTVMGGVHATFMHEQILTHYSDLVDRVVLGEGEQTFLELVERLEKGQTTDQVPGMAFAQNGTVKKTAQRFPIVDLDSLPFPEQNTFKFDEFPGKRTAVLLSSRGCGFACAYCSATRFWGKWRMRSPGNVVEEIRKLVETKGADHIALSDDSFCADASRTIEICNRICETGLHSRCSFNCFARADHISSDLLRAMKDANFVRISYGIESGSPEMLRAMNKRTTRKQALDAIRLTADAGIQPFACLMVGNPGETQQTIDQTCQFIRHTSLKEIGVSKHTYIFPGTPLEKRAKAEGLLTDDFWLKPQVFLPYTTDHSVDQLAKWQAQVFKSALKNMSLREKADFLFRRIRNLSIGEFFKTFWHFLKP